MDMTILNHQNRQPFGGDQEALLERVLKHAARKMELDEDVELSVVIMDNEGIWELNREYRGVDRPTDVLSFAMQETGEDEPDYEDPDSPLMLGDIIISVEKAAEQAAEYGHSPERELAFLAVHGFLHLLGYDHMEPEDERVMLELQREILGELGLDR